MKKIKFISLLFMALCMMTIVSCQRRNADGDGGNAVYYWKTTFRLNDYERDFLRNHHITKMYVKFFDVDDTWDGVVPVGTLMFLDSMPQNVEIVPTVFITADAIESYEEYIMKLYNRIVAMAETNGVEFHEIQIDCDWTEDNKDAYFAFMKEFRAMLQKQDIKLSATIRLFQLGYEAPAADYGVLMCYNTGDLKNWETTNSILDPSDLKMWLPKLKTYKLPLSIAFPQFTWDISFNHDKEMLYINYDQKDLNNRKLFKKIGKNRYEVVADEERELDDNGKPYYSYYETYYIRHEESELGSILDAKDMLLENMANKPLQVVIYHLDSANLSKLSDNDVEKIYR